MLEKILNRWKFLLDQFDAEPKAVLAKELLKITPSQDVFEVDWRMSGGYDEETNIYRFNYTIKVAPVYSIAEGDPVDLYEYFARLFSNMPAEDLKRLNRSLKSMQKNIALPYRLEPAMFPCMLLAPEIGMIMFKVKGEAVEDYEEEIQNNINLMPKLSCRIPQNFG